MAVDPAVTTRIDWYLAGDFGAAIDTIRAPMDIRIRRGRSADFTAEALGECTLTIRNDDHFFTPERNWHDNPSFEVGTSGWSTAAIASLTAAATSITQVTDNAGQGGTKAGEAVLTATSNSGVTFAIPYRFKSGVTYSLSVWLKSTAGALSVRAGIASSGTPADIASTSSNITASWAQYTTTWTPSADRTDAVVFVRTTAAATATVRIDAIQLNAGASLNTYLEAPTKAQLVPGRPVHIQATHSGSGTTRAKFYGFIERITPHFREKTVEIVCYDVLRKLTETDIVVPAYSFVQRCARDFRIGVLEDFERGNRNLVGNPSFETDTTGWSFSGTSLTRITTDGAQGTCCAEWVAAALNNRMTYPLALAPVFFSAQTYRLSAYLRTTAGTLDVGLGLGIDTATQFSEMTVTATTSWQRFTVTYTMPSSQRADGASPLQVLIRATAAGTLRVDGVSVTRGQPLYPYADSGAGRWPNWVGNGGFDGQALNGWYDGWTNLVTNPSFEVNTTGWTNVTRSTTAPKFGVGHGAIGAGVNATYVLSGTFKSGVTYDLLFWCRAQAGSTSWNASYIGSLGTPADRTTFSDGMSTTYAVIRKSWTPSSDRADAQIFLTSAGATYIDAVMVTRRDSSASQGINSYADIGPGGGGSFVTARTTATTQAKYGGRSQQVDTPATATAGRIYDFNLAGAAFGSAQPFTLSLWLYPVSVNMPYKVGISANKADGTFDEASTTGTATAGQWTQVTVTWTPSAARAAGTFMDAVLFVYQTDATARTFYIDGVRVIPGNSADEFEMGQWSIGSGAEVTDTYLTTANLTGTALSALSTINGLELTRHWIKPTTASPWYQYMAEDRTAFKSKTSVAALSGSDVTNDTDFVTDRTSIANVVAVSYTSGVEYYSDASSVGDGTSSNPGFGPRPASTVNGTGYFSGRTIPDSVGPDLVARYKVGTLRPTIERINDFPNQLSIDLGDLVTLTSTAALFSGAPFVVLSEDLRIEPSGKWTTQWALEAYPY